VNRGSLWLDRATDRRRFGLKGPHAAELLKQHGCNVPPQPNTWAPLHAADRDDSPNVIARLGRTEFFIEELGQAPGIRALESVARDAANGAYPVLRDDLAVILGGVHAAAVLAEVCNVDFAALSPSSKPAVMTLVTGVGVLVLPQQVETGPDSTGTIYRIWCDPSFGSYLWETLAEVVSNNGRAA